MNTPDDMRHVLADALHLAADVHAGEKKRGTDVAAIYHPLAVASLVLQHGGSGEQAVAAILHDAYPLLDAAALRERFGLRVDAYLRTFDDPPMPEGLSWRHRRGEYARKLELVGLEELFVAACEELHEVTQLAEDLLLRGDLAWDRFDSASDDVAWYFTRLDAIFEARLLVRAPGLVRTFTVAARTIELCARAK